MAENPLLAQAEAKRTSASRARRLASTVSQDADKDRLLEYAQEQDCEADELERQAVEQVSRLSGGGAPTHRQEQPQQEGATGSQADPSERKPRP